MASKLDELKNDSASNLTEYAQQHKEYKSEIDTLNKDTNDKQDSFFSLSQELKGMDREDDSLAFDAKKEATEKAEDSYISAQTAENEKQSEFTQYKEDNPSYSGMMEKQEQLQESVQDLKDLAGTPENATNETVGQDYEAREGRPLEQTVYPNDTVGGGNSEGAGGDSPNSKLAELAEEAKKDPQIENTSKAIENTKENDSLDSGDQSNTKYNANDNEGHSLNSEKLEGVRYKTEERRTEQVKEHANDNEQDFDR